MRLKLLVLAVLSAGTLAAEPRCKVICHGWDTMRVSPQLILENAAAFDELPVDGVVVFPKTVKTAAGKSLNAKTLPQDEAWSYDLFADQAPVLREFARHRGLRHSLLGVWINNSWRKKDTAHRLAWTDDAAWARFANNLGVLVRLAHEGGLEGICIDNEDYSGIRQYFWQEADGDFASVRKLARQRGREVFGAAFREKPDLKVLAFWFMSWPFGNYLACDDPVRSREEVGDLWADFVNGMLDVIPPEAQFIDGNETTYYDRADRNDCYRKAKALFRNALPIVEPENRVKYRGQLLAAPAHYLDSYFNTSGEFYMPPTEGGTRLDRFVENFDQTVYASDGWIWLYGERHPFIRWKGTDQKACLGPTWNEALPGMYETIGCFREAGRQGAQTFARWLREGRTPETVLKGGDFALTKDLAGKGFLENRFPDGVDSWKHGKTPGAFGTDASVGHGDGFSLRLDKIQRGCLMRVIPAKPGERYVVRVFAKGESANFSVGYLTGKTQRTDVYSPRGSFGPADKDGWREGFAYAIVPKGADTLRVYLGCNRNETLWYDDLAIYLDSPANDFRHSASDGHCETKK